MNNTLEEQELKKYLLKCELEWRAEKHPEGGWIDWLYPHCMEIYKLADFIEGIGFQIKGISYKDKYSAGYLETTNGIIFYENDEDSIFIRSGRFTTRKHLEALMEPYRRDRHGR